MYAQTLYYFRQIDPAKKFTQFSYSELNWNEVNTGDCRKDEVLKIDGNFFLYAGEKINYCKDPKYPVIIFKNRKTIIKEIPG